MKGVLMVSITEGSTIKCAECGKESTVDYSHTDNDGHIGLELSCGCRNSWCFTCNAPTREISDSSSYIYAFCDTCVSKQDEADAAELEFLSTLPQKPKKSYPRHFTSLPKKPKLTVEQKREIYPRAYDPWTVDEDSALCLHAKFRSQAQLIAIFERQPEVISKHVAEKSMVISFSGQSAVHLLGKDIVCGGCGRNVLT
jgi:hypothetical protein